MITRYPELRIIIYLAWKNDQRNTKKILKKSIVAYLKLLIRYVYKVRRKSLKLNRRCWAGNVVRVRKERNACTVLVRGVDQTMKVKYD